MKFDPKCKTTESCGKIKNNDKCMHFPKDLYVSLCHVFLITLPLLTALTTLIIIVVFTKSCVLISSGSLHQSGNRTLSPARSVLPAADQ